MYNISMRRLPLSSYILSVTVALFALQISVFAQLPSADIEDAPSPPSLPPLPTSVFTQGAESFLSTTSPFFNPSMLGIPEDLPQLFENLNPPVIIESNPASPGAGQTVTITARTPATEVKTSEFTWTVNGTVRSDVSGSAKNTITVTAGDTGTSIRVSVRVRRLDGTVLTASKQIYVSDLALIWKARTYVPPWYRGKALPTKNSIVTISAIPTVIIDGRLIPPNRLIFTWHSDGRQLAAGAGEQIVDVVVPRLPFMTRVVQVTVEDFDKKIRKEQRIALGPREPHVSVYALEPLGGIESRRSVTTLPVTSRGTLDFQAEPFHFPVLSKDDLTYRWRFNGKDVQGLPQNPFILSIDAANETRRDIGISVNVDDADTYVPPASKLFNVSFQ